MMPGSGARHRWHRLRDIMRERGTAGGLIEILSGRMSHASRRLARCSARLSLLAATRYPQAQRRDVLARNGALAGALDGERVFVLATGPSATQLDLARLRGETVIAANESFQLLARNAIKPFAVAAIDTAYATEREQYLRFLADLGDYARAQDAIVLLNLDSRPFFEARGFFAGARVHYLDFAGDLVDLAPVPSKFRLDLTKALPGLYTVSHAAAAAALACGARNVYLLGVDLDYVLTPHAPVQHGYGANPYNDHDSRTTLEIYAREYGWDYADILYHVHRQQRCFAILAEIAARSGQRLANATPGGLLETLPRVSFESLFADLDPRPDAVDGDRSR
jgi:hypothetical protein